MKTRKGLIALAVTFVSSLMLFTACKHHDAKGAFALDYITETLDLTREQETNLDFIRAEIVDKVQEMHADKKEMHAILKEQLESETIDKDVVRKLVADHREKMNAVIDLAIDKLADFHETLTPEQKTKLVAKLEKFEKLHDKSNI